MIYRTALEILNYHMLSLEFSESEIANGNYDLVPVTGRLLYPHAPSRFEGNISITIYVGLYFTRSSCTVSNWKQLPSFTSKNCIPR